MGKENGASAMKKRKVPSEELNVNIYYSGNHIQTIESKISTHFTCIAN